MLCKIWITFIDLHFSLISVVNSTEHQRTDISEFRAPTLVALTIVALKSVALTSSH